MVRFTFVVVLALALTACAGITERLGLTPDQQACVATGVADAVANYEGELGALELAAQGVWVAGQVHTIADACAIDLNQFAAARAIDALLEAAIAEQG